jgi:hypothetical protein
MPRIPKAPKDQGKPVWVTVKDGWKKPQSFVVGYVKGDTFFKTVTGSKHFLKDPPAIAFGADSIRDAKAMGATEIHIYDKQARRHYFTTMLVLEKDGGHLDRGYGEQVYLQLGLWNQMSEEEYRQARGEPFQPRLEL